MGPKSRSGGVRWGPVGSGGDRLCQTRLIPRSPDGDKNSHGLYIIASLHPSVSCEGRNLLLVSLLAVIRITWIFIAFDKGPGLANFPSILAFISPAVCTLMS